ncbi:MAG TPA: low affinity iron permease family protein [Actinomycetota bacterium]
MGSGWFDRFAERSARITSKAAFFAACLLLVVAWGLSYWFFGNLNTWQLVINTATTVITFLLVALLQNSQRRGEQALQAKLDAIADGVADLMEQVGSSDARSHSDIRDLRHAVGIEEKAVAD